MSANKVTSFRPDVESLEDRCLLSAGLSVRLPVGPHKPVHGHRHHGHGHKIKVEHGVAATGKTPAFLQAPKPTVYHRIEVHGGGVLGKKGQAGGHKKATHGHKIKVLHGHGHKPKHGPQTGRK
jgi:hypothetical protein